MGKEGRTAQGHHIEAEEGGVIVSVYKQPKSKNWWYKFTWNGDVIRESTKQTNKRVADQMEAAHRTALAKGEVGIREKKLVPTLKTFAEQSFLPFVRSTFAAKPKTLAYYQNGVDRLLMFHRLSGERLDAITTDRIAEYVCKRQEAQGKRLAEGSGAAIQSDERVLEAFLGAA